MLYFINHIILTYANTSAQDTNRAEDLHKQIKYLLKEREQEEADVCVWSNLNTFIHKHSLCSQQNMNIKRNHWLILLKSFSYLSNILFKQMWTGCIISNISISHISVRRYYIQASCQLGGGAQSERGRKIITKIVTKLLTFKNDRYIHCSCDSKMRNGALQHELMEDLSTTDQLQKNTTRTR